MVLTFKRLRIEQPDDDHAADREGQHRELAGVEHRDDHDRGEVVDHRDRGEEDLQRDRDPAAEHGEDAQREGDVGCRGNRPSVHRERVTAVHEGIDPRGNRDAADSRDEGQGDLGGRGKLTEEHLPLQLEADQQEEDRHQAVVDPEQERLLDHPFADADRAVGLEDRAVPLAPELAVMSAAIIAMRRRIPGVAL